MKVYTIEATREMTDEESGSPGGPAQPTDGVGAVCVALLSQRSKHTPVATRCSSSSSSSLVSLFSMRNPALRSLLPLHHHPANNNCLSVMHISHILQCSLFYRRL